MAGSAKKKDRDPESLLPLPRLGFQILLALAAGDNHGYEIAKEIEHATGGRFKPGTGSLYLALARLQKQGLIEETAERPPEAQDDSRRRYYRITEFGRQVAQAEGRRLVGLVNLARQRHLIDDAVAAGPGSAAGEA